MSADDPAFAQAPVPDDWWRLYDDPKLNALVTEALSENADLRVAQANLEQAGALVSVAEAGRDVSTTISGGTSLGRPSSTGISLPGTVNYDIGASASYPLDLSGRLARGIEAARADAEAAVADFQRERAFSRELKRSKRRSRSWSRSGRRRALPPTWRQEREWHSIPSLDGAVEICTSRARTPANRLNALAVYHCARRLPMTGRYARLIAVVVAITAWSVPIGAQPQEVEGANAVLPWAYVLNEPTSGNADAPDPDDGFRVLVMRLWPRGIRKGLVDTWDRGLSPSRGFYSATNSPGCRVWGWLYR
mgnify:CR=1 FL=1